ncbi:MAG: 23S rRNA (pseudouridine(1915)-N(3))-methyltransferase RlmH [Pseudomonadales bacterium]|nr:23S rRNA (pseudouridine(1915)-N(3))-methyltransferase RlmH [Pseudomonadales bacterium]
MKLRIVAAGQRLPAWVDAGYQEYARRMPREFALRLSEIPIAPRKALPVDRARREEGERMLQQIDAAERVVALAVDGIVVTTEELAQRLGRWERDGRDVVFLIGGPDGLDEACLERADERVSLSALTFPHGLVRVMLAEQLYRAWTLRAGHPYHRA